MNRRGFLGSIIGIYLSTKLPFVAEPISFTRSADRLFKNKQAIRLFECPESELMKYKGIVFQTDGEHFAAPKMLQVDRDMKKLTCSFRFEDVETHKSIAIKGCGILTPEGVLMCEKNFSATVPMINGDILKVNHRICLGDLS